MKACLLPRPLALLAPGPSVRERFLRRTPWCVGIATKAELRSYAALRPGSESQGFWKLPSSLALLSADGSTVAKTAHAHEHD